MLSSGGSKAKKEIDVVVGGKVNRDSKQKPSGIVMKVKVTIYEDVWKIISWSRKLEDRLLKRMNAMNC